MGRPVIEDFINFNSKVGPLQLLEIGYPGSGKSSHATQLLIKCFERNNNGHKETAIMHGDLSCEWRHFLRYSKFVKKIKVLIPKGVEPIRIGIENLYNYKVNLDIISELDFNSINFIEHLKAKELTVVYDDCFNSISKTKLWMRIASQLISREKLLDHTITYLCHEAGNYYPQTARGDQWSDVDSFCERFVYFRKMNIRAILLAQLENEVYERLRKKCIYRVYRICYPSNRTHAKRIKKYILKMKISNYHLFYGDIFNPLRENKATKEIRSRSMMIPCELINLNGSTLPNSSSKKVQKARRRCPQCKHEWIPKVLNPVKCPNQLCQHRFDYPEMIE